MEKIMKIQDRKKIAKILKENERWPVIIQGISAKIFKNAIIIPADIPSSELGTKIDDKGNIIFPNWLEKLKQMEKMNKAIIVCIDGLDKIDPDEQQKFYGMLKYNGINGYKFSNATRIVIATFDSAKISKGLADLALFVKVE